MKSGSDGLGAGEMTKAGPGVEDSGRGAAESGAWRARWVSQRGISHGGNCYGLTVMATAEWRERTRQERGKKVVGGVGGSGGSTVVEGGGCA